MRLLLVQAAHINFNVCVTVMGHTGAAARVGEKYTMMLPLPKFSFTPLRCLCRHVTKLLMDFC